MGSIFSALSHLKSPLSLFTGDGDDVGEWSETALTHVLRVEVPWLKKDDSVNAAVVECEDHVMKLKISCEIKRTWKTFTFTKLVELPKNGGIFHQVFAVVYDGCFFVTIPKVEEV